jgi:hypothetical protein
MEACPKCNFVLAPEAAECPACGVILAKLKAASGLHRQIQPVSAPLAVPPPLPARSPLSLVANPYAPPAAAVEASTPPLPAAMPAPAAAAAPAPDMITPSTLETLDTLRSWLRFMSIYGLIVNGLCVIGGIVVGLNAGDEASSYVVSFIYLVYGVIGFFILQPLRRSADAVEHIPLKGASLGVETFVKEMTSFWRRIGWFCVGTLLLIGLGFVMGAFAGFLKGL